MTDVIPERLGLARELGAQIAFDPRDEDERERLLEAAGLAYGEFDVAFDAVGITATFQQALLAVRPGRMVVALGGWQTVSVNLGPLVAREINVRGAFNFTTAEFEEARRMLSSAAEASLDRIVTTSHPMMNGADVFDQMVENRAENIKVVLTSIT